MYATKLQNLNSQSTIKNYFKQTNIYLQVSWGLCSLAFLTETSTVMSLIITNVKWNIIDTKPTKMHPVRKFIQRQHFER